MDAGNMDALSGNIPPPTSPASSQNHGQDVDTMATLAPSARIIDLETDAEVALEAASETAPETAVQAAEAEPEAAAAMPPPPPPPPPTANRGASLGFTSSDDFVSPKRQKISEGDCGEYVGVSEAALLDANSCTICFEPWTSAGRHRLVALKCGHLFGRDCIERWLAGTGSACPQCNAPSRKNDIRVLYCKGLLTAVDTSAAETALRELGEEKTRREEAEAREARATLKLQVVEQELRQVRENGAGGSVGRGTTGSRVVKAGATVEAAATGTATAALAAPGASSTLMAGLGALGRPYALQQEVQLLHRQGSRALDVDTVRGSLLVSVDSLVKTPFFPNGSAGVIKLSTLNFRTQEYVQIHKQSIRDMRFSCPEINCLLTTSLDRTVKVTSFVTNSVVQSYRVPCTAWSCAWNPDKPVEFACGLQNGTVLTFDMRNTSRAIRNDIGQRRVPVTCVQYMPSSQGFTVPGLLTCSLGGAAFWAADTAGCEYLLPSLEGACVWASVDAGSQRCLLSFKPSARTRAPTRHAIVSLSRAAEAEAVDAEVHRNIFGDYVATRMSRPLLVPGASGPNSSSDGGRTASRIVAGVESRGLARIWDSETGETCQELRSTRARPFLAFAAFGQGRLAGLCDGVIKLYRPPQ